MMFDSSYLVLPDKNAKPYALLADGDGRVGPGGHRSLRDAPEGVPGGHPLRWQRTSRCHARLPRRARRAGSVEEFEELDEVDDLRQGAEDGKSLVEALSDDFQPEQYQRRVPHARRADHRTEGGRADPGVRGAARRAWAAVIDLAAALEASLDEARAAK